MESQLRYCLTLQDSVLLPCSHQTLDLDHGLAFGYLLITLLSIVFRYFLTTATIKLSIWTMDLSFTPFDYFATTKLYM
jgi:hypothetical protein